MQSLYNSCEADIDQSKLTSCLATNKAIMDSRLNNRFGSLLSGAKPEIVQAGNELDRYAQDKSNQRATRAQTPTDRGAVTETAANPANLTKIFNADRLLNGVSAQDLGFQKNILAFRKAFMYLLEVLMLVLGLVAPIFVGLSMFPVGTKPLVSWGILFLGAGFCKVCYTLISGVSAVAIVLSGPKQVDMLVFGVIVGGLAPVLSLVISSVLSSSLSSAVTSVAYQGQSYGMNTGVSSGAPSGLNSSNQQGEYNSPDRKKN
jgi:hypothetical protein